MKTKTFIIVLFIGAAAAILYLTSGRGDRSAAPVTPAAESTAAVEVTTLYSTEKQEWMEAAAVAFQKAHPAIRIKLIGKGSLEAAQAILDGTERPAVFSPADSMVLALLASDWQTKNHADLFAVSGDDAPQPLVITPVVFVVWQDRADALLRGTSVISWKTIHKAVVSNQGWPAVGGKPEWGFVKLGHTDPTRSNSGLQALLLMALEFYPGRPALEVGDLLRPDYQAFVRETEKGVGRFEASTGTFMTDMIRFGPSKYDMAVVYENLAIAQIENAQGRWGNLRVYYPSVTIWSDHPAALLSGEWVSVAQQKAAREWIAFLRSRPMQEQALAYGFRPADPSVPVMNASAQNPFTRLAQYGVRVELPPVARVPDGAFVRTLMTMWSRVVATH
jgi:ABC-type molybdate transport system substrate-binding protein